VKFTLARLFLSSGTSGIGAAVGSLVGAISAVVVLAVGAAIFLLFGQIFYE